MAEEKQRSSWGYFLKVGGILCAIGAGSALLITGANLITAPIIAANNEAAQTGAYAEIFSECVAVSDEVAVEGGKYVYAYYVAYADGDKTQTLGNIYLFEGSCQYGKMGGMVGISGAQSSPTLGKVKLLTNEVSYASTLNDKYVTPYNASPSDETLDATSCGATVAANVLKAMIEEARDLYKSGGVASKEDIASEVKAIFGENVYVASDPSKVELAGTYVTKYIPVYCDSYLTEEYGHVLSASALDGTFGMGVGFTGTKDEPHYDKAYVWQNDTSYADIDSFVASYNANPGNDALTGASSEGELLVKSIIEEAASLFVGVDDLRTRSREIFSSAVDYGEVIHVSDASYASMQAYWDVYSETLEEGSEDTRTPSGRIYKMATSMHEDYVEEEHHSIDYDVVFLVGIYGEASSPKVGKLSIFLNSNTIQAQSGKDGLNGYIDSYTDDTSDETIDAYQGTGGTYTAKAIATAVKSARSHYAASLAASTEEE